MKKLLCFLLAISFLMVVVSKLNYTTASASELVDSGINYNESLNALSNPDRGMFYLYQIYVKDNATSGQVLQGSKVSGRLTEPDFKKFLDGSYNYPEGTTTFVLSFGLEYFSKKAGGSDIELTQNALTYIKNTLAEAEKAGATVIVRFCYDLLGNTYDTKKDCEPSMDLMLRHIEQLGPILTQYNGIITAVQSGMFGPWGEQHTTSVSDYNNANNYYQMIDKWLSVTPSDMWILVRRTRFFVHWYNVKYSKSYTTSTINQIVCRPGTPEYRIGCYNDGYLADKTDWDTYVNRTAEIAWLESQTYAPYGGEVCSDASGLNNYNKISYMEVEAFKTHTSFLNYLWDYDKVIKNWEKETYNGADAVYKGKTSSFTYVLNHLGYRLVLRQSKLTNNVQQGGTLSLEGKIENVGFGNISREQKVFIVIANSSGNEVYSQLTNISSNSFLSRQNVSYSAQISLPNSLGKGNYKAYMKLVGSNQTGASIRTISFANENIYNSSLGANYLGEFTITDNAQNSSASSSSVASSSISKSSSSKSSSSKSSSSKSSSSKSSSSKSSSSKSSSSKSSSSKSSTVISSSIEDSQVQISTANSSSNAISSVEISIKEDSSLLETSTVKSSSIKKEESSEEKSSSIKYASIKKHSKSGTKSSSDSGCSSSISGDNALLFAIALTIFIAVLFMRKNEKA